MVLGGVLQVDGDLQDLLVVVYQEGEQSAGQKLVQILRLLAAQHTLGEGVHHLENRPGNTYITSCTQHGLRVKRVKVCVCVCVCVRGFKQYPDWLQQLQFVQILLTFL